MKQNARKFWKIPEIFCLQNSGNFQKFPGSLIPEISGNFLDVKMKQNARKVWKFPEITKHYPRNFLFHLTFKKFPEISGINAGKFRKFLDVALSLIPEISRKF